eukprot:Gb_00320 [translate_table: standard]
MKGGLTCLLLVIMILFASNHVHNANGVDHRVGGSTGWEPMDGNVNFYKNWAASVHFVVGDTLVFNSIDGEDDVIEVSKSAYESCRAEISKGGYDKNATPIIELNRTGDWHFISGFPQHCNSGKKLELRVDASEECGTYTPMVFTLAKRVRIGEGGGDAGRELPRWKRKRERGLPRWPKRRPPSNHPKSIASSSAPNFTLLFLAFLSIFF